MYSKDGFYEDDGYDTGSSLDPSSGQTASDDDWSDGMRGLENSLFSQRRDIYTVAWICALSIEMAAARAMLDDVHEGLVASMNDSNTYILGSMGKHNVVIACLPNHLYGTNNAANVLTNLVRTFPSIRLGMMVGIGGGVPSMADIRLGDVVVGTRVMQYDLGKIVQDGQIRRTAIPKTPHQLFGTAVSVLRAEHELKSSRIPAILREKMGEYPEFGRPRLMDRLYAATYEHAYMAPDCGKCDKTKLLPRRIRASDDPSIHYGVIASGNQVMRSGTMRDNVARQLDAICFEMEAAGLMDILPCLPIRGICDYSDSHKNKEWQKYAAATAAAYAKDLLDIIPAFEAPRNASYASQGQRQPSFIDDLAQSRGAAAREAALRRRMKLLNSLRYDQIDARKVGIKSAYAKTCQWFLSHPDYQAWLDPERLPETRGFLWLRGKPGAGKSTIMKFIYLQVKKTSQGKNAAIASFFFNARGKYLEKSISGMYRSLLVQLLEDYPDLQAVFDDKDLIPRHQMGCPPLNVLKELFYNAVSGLGQRLFTCFVDALDECDEQQVRTMIQDLEELADVSTERGIPFRICFSSRHYPYIAIRYGLQVTLEDQQGHAEDLASYAKNRLEIKDTALVEELRAQILDKAAGVFLWVVLVVDILNRENRRGRMAMRKRLAELPTGLSELFKDMLRRDQENMEDFLLCIVWILFAKRPLKPEEYYHALWSGLSLEGLADDEIPSVTGPDAAETVRNCVISSSKGLIEITKSESPTVQFIHESVRDFLIKDKGLHELWPDLGFDCETPSHERLKQCCSKYLDHPSIRKHSLAMDDPTLLPTLDLQSWNSAYLAGSTLPPLTVLSGALDGYPFIQYASENVLFHANLAAIAIPQNDFLSEFQVFGWINIANHFEDESKKYTSENLLDILARNNLANLIRIHPEKTRCFEFGDAVYGPPLFAALASGSHEAVLAFMERHAPAQLNGLPFDLCKWYSDSEDKQIHWGSKFKFSRQRGIASHIIEKGDEVIFAFALISGNIDWQARGEGGQTPLSNAAHAGWKTVVQLLLERGVDIESRDSSGRTPLLRAAIAGRDTVVQILLEKGADIKCKEKSGRTPLSRAAGSGRAAVVRLLLATAGIEADAKDRDGRTPLSYAAESGDRDVVQLLLENGVDINSKDSFGRTPLSHAASSRRGAVVRLLLEKGADFESRDKNGQTPLSHAAVAGAEEVIQLLLEKGVNIESRDKNGQTPLSHAACSWWEPTIRLFLAKGADKESRDNSGQTPLCHAAKSGRDAAVQLLLRMGADIESKDNNGQTPLSHAANLGMEQVVRLLLKGGASAESKDKYGQTPFAYATRSGSEFAEQILWLLKHHPGPTSPKVGK
ncbi:hypothetical protein TWF696_008599 [Orbilia brochopaga]|uniref:Nucleoside phosphorylase domain-containing protein n=1 Tax=Orbilia brochopaga TaxID=3140254 RepID=A0AAV9UJR3_9PEZI